MMIRTFPLPRAAQFAAVTVLLLISASAVFAQGTGNQTNASPNTGILAGANNIATNSTNAFIGAGSGNLLQGVRLSAIVAGTNNAVVNNSAFSFIGAGQNNSVQFGFNTVVVAGINNTNSGGRSVIVGGRANTLGRFSASSTIAGGEFNTIQTVNTQVFGTLLAGTIGGGISNLIGSNGFAATIGGGIGNQALAKFTGIAAGQGNIVADLSTGSVIGGGASNSITATEFFEVDEFDQIIATNPAIATIAGGGSNTVSGAVSFVGGGAFNTNNGWFSVIVGGISNTVAGFNEQTQTSGNFSYIGGGYSNVVTGPYSTIAGGEENRAADWGIIPGGYGNEAGIDSFAAGNLAKATNQGAFVWSGYWDEEEPVATVSTNDYSFTVRAPGGARFITSTNTSSFVGVILTNAATAWASLSDSNSKTDFEKIKPREILSKVAAMPVTSWHYKHDLKRRYIGPMAQDFHNAFGLGSDDKTISTLDSDGVMYAAIQGLVEELKLRDKDIEALKAELQALREEVRSNLPPAE